MSFPTYTCSNIAYDPNDTSHKHLCTYTLSNGPVQSFKLTTSQDDDFSIYYGFFMSNGSNFQPVYDSSKSSKQLLELPTISVSSGNVSIYSAVKSVQKTSSVDITSSFGGVVVTIDNYGGDNVFYVYPREEEQLLFSPTSAFNAGDYMVGFNIVDANSINWRIAGSNIQVGYDLLKVRPTDIIYKHGTQDASNVSFSFLDANFASVVTGSEGVTVTNYKEGPFIGTTKLMDTSF